MWASCFGSQLAAGQAQYRNLKQLLEIASQVSTRKALKGSPGYRPYQLIRCNTGSLKSARRQLTTTPDPIS